MQWNSKTALIVCVNEQFDGSMKGFEDLVTLNDNTVCSASFRHSKTGLLYLTASCQSTLTPIVVSEYNDDSRIGINDSDDGHNSGRK